MICLDANVLIEVALGRVHATECKKFIDGTTDDLGITTLTLDLVMYYAERHKLHLPTVQAFLELFVWLPLTESDARWAFEHYAQDDYEDALQIGCAQREGVKKFVTLDKKLARKYADVIPTQLLGRSV